MTASVLFYKTIWTDSASVLSYIAHTIREGNPPKYTHVAYEYDGTVYEFCQYGLFQHNLAEDNQYDCRIILDYDAEPLKYIIDVYNLTGGISSMEAIKFIKKDYSYNCASFVCHMLGLPGNKTVTDLYNWCKKHEQNREIKTETSECS